VRGYGGTNFMHFQGEREKHMGGSSSTNWLIALIQSTFSFHGVIDLFSFSLILLP
jgi:hypothetical protein